MSIVASQLVGDVTIRGISQASSDLSRMGTETNTAQKGLDQLTNRSEEAGSSLAGHFTGGLRSAVSGFLDFGAKLGTTIFGIKSLADTVLGWGASLLKPAASLEQVQSSLEIFTGSTAKAKKELQELSDFAAHTPFETSAIDNAALKLQGVGINANLVKPYILALGDSLDAMGRTSSADLDQLVTNFSKIQTTGHLTTEVMNSFADAGIDAWTVLEKQTGKTHEQLAALISAGLYPAKDAMNDLTKGIEASPLYKGQMANDTASLNGALSTLKSTFNNVLAQFGDPIIKGLEPIVNNLSAAFSSKGFQDFAGNIGSGIVAVFQGIGNAAQYVGNVLHSINLTPFTTAWNSLKTSVAPLGDVFKHLGSVFSDIGSDADPIADIIQKIASSGLGTITNLIQGLANALSGLGQNKAVQGLLSSLVSGFQQVSAIVGGQLGQNFQLFGSTLQQVGQWFQSSMMPALQQAMPAFERLGSILFTTVAPAIAKVWAVGEGLARQVMPYIIQAFETVAPILVKVGGFIADNLGKAIQFLTPYIVQAAQAIGSFASQIISFVVPIIQQIWSQIKAGIDFILPLWNAVWPSMQKVLGGVWNMIVGTVKIAWSIVSGIIKVGMDLVQGKWSQAWNDIKGIFSGVWDGIKQYARGAWDALSGIIRGGINFVIGLLNNFIGGLNKLHIDVGDVHVGLNIPLIPLLAKGTSFFGGGTAVVGEGDEPEVVAGAHLVNMSRGAGVYPLSKWQGMNQPPTVVVQPPPIYLDGRLLSSGLMPYIANQIRYQGGIIG